jgi:ribosome-binding factor A
MTGEAKRSTRVGEQIRAELMELLLRGTVRDPRAADVVVSEVRVTEDLSLAHVYVRSVHQDSGSADQAVKVMEGASGFLRRELGKRLRLRKTPELEFHWDEVVDRALRVESLLDEIRDESGQGDDEEES